MAAARIPVLARVTVLSALALLAACNDTPPGEPEPTGRLTGKILEATRSTPIAGAMVTVENQPTTTAADGSFELTGLPVRNLLLKVSAPGFESFEETITLLAGDNQRDIRLSVRTFYPYSVDSDSFAVYIPPFVDTLRGVLFVIGGALDGSLSLVRGSPLPAPPLLTDPAQFLEWHTKLRAFADAEGFALLGEDALRPGVGDLGRDLVRRAVERLPQEVSRPELQYTPLLLIGHGTGACKAMDFTAVAAEQVVGFIAMKDACPLFPIPNAHAVPGYMFIGETDTFAINDITKVFEINRPPGALWALAVEAGAGHTLVADLDLLAEWLKTVIELRLPQNVTPGQPVILRTIDQSVGWLANRETFEIGTFACYNADKSKAAWLPSMQAAKRWQAMASRGTVNTVIGC
ncbi:MAG: carboxypeptidase regulatory-like domain-containing protein [Longimicrobiales bacterium]